MFGVTFRAAIAVAVMPVGAAMLGRILEELIPLFNAPDSMLAAAFQAVADHALVIGLMSALVLLLAQAVTESEVPQ